jgi:hypothetical protein
LRLRIVNGRDRRRIEGGDRSYAQQVKEVILRARCKLRQLLIRRIIAEFALLWSPRAVPFATGFAWCRCRGVHMLAWLRFE